jgi:hypothetical protein
MVEVTNALQLLPQRQLRIVPLDLVKEISATPSGLRRKSLLDQLCNYLLGGELEDRAVLVLDLPVGVIDDVEDRVGVEVGGKYILPVPELQNLGAIGELHNHFDRGILQGTDHARDTGPGLELVRDSGKRGLRFSRVLTVAGARDCGTACLTISPRRNSRRFLPGGCELRHYADRPRRVPGFARHSSRATGLPKESRARGVWDRKVAPLVTKGQSDQVLDD